MESTIEEKTSLKFKSLINDDTINSSYLLKERERPLIILEKIK